MTSPVQQQFSNNSNHHTRHQNMQQQQMVLLGTGDIDVEQKKLLEWELSSLGADDLRSHAWYHGNRVDRAEAERLLRQCIADEHGFSITSFGSSINTSDLGASPRKEDDNAKDSDSDGVENASSVSSESDFAIDDLSDGLVDDQDRIVSDLSTSMATTLLLQQRRRVDCILPSTNIRHPRRHNRRYFYCFLVRDSLNVRPPGRYVVSCLRVDKYDEKDNKNNKNNNAGNAENEQKRMQFLRRQRRRRQRRQQRHPVLHFVINEIILQPGTVYERSQFTFGDTLPTVASMTSTTSAMTINYNGELNGQRTYQPGFDSVPDLIRYYVGGADDNAVLSYGGGNDGVASSCSNSTMFSQPSHTEVRIRYPCNRRRPLMTFQTLDGTPSLISKTAEHSKILEHHSHGPDTTTALAEPLQLPSSVSINETGTISSFTHSYRQRRSPSPPSLHNSNRKHSFSSSFRSSLRRTPSATVTSLRPSSAAESVTSSLSSTISLQSSSNSSPSLLRANHPVSTLSSSFIPCSSTMRPRSNVSQFPDPKSLTFGPCSSNFAPRSLTTISYTNKPPKLPESVSCKSSTLKHIKTSGKCFEKDSISETNNGACGGSNIIDVDAEITTALFKRNVDNDYHSGVIHLPELSVIQSSFARVNLNNRYQNKNHSYQGRPCGDRSRSRSHQHRPKSHQNQHENQFIFEQRNTEYPLDNTIKVCEHKQQNIESKSGNDGYIHNYGPQQQKQQLQQISSFADPPSTLSMLNVQVIEEKKQLVINTEELMQFTELNEQNTEKHVTDLEIKLLANKEQMDLGSGVEKYPLVPMENEDFEGWRNRWAHLLRRKVVSAQTKRLQECKLYNERLQTLKIELEERNQRYSRENLEHVEVNSEETFANRTSLTHPHSIVSDIRPEMSVSATVAEQHSIADSEAQYTGNFDGALTENMVLYWLGIQDVNLDNDIFSIGINNITNQNSEMKSIQQKRQFGRPSVVLHNYRSKTENDEILLNLTTTKHTNIKSTGKSVIASEIDSEKINIESQLICDYENINLLKDNGCLDNSVNDKNIGSLNSKYGCTDFKRCIDYNTTVGIDYENIVEENDYQNVGILSRNHYQEKLQKKMNDSRGSSTAVVNALRAVHLTIVGNPDDGGLTSVGTGRLAAALCRADGRATILPYRRYKLKCDKGDAKRTELNLNTCPLQLLGQPGLAGRRARLDVIERFACLQYLVAMTVIVTPCFILIGGDYNQLQNPAVDCSKWSLEDEYEYRRRRFYYRCSGAAGWYFSDNNPVSEDDDEYQLSADSDFDSDYSLLQRDEWINEKRHWLDQLARHRAAALDKWIRTAADVKQAVGDVFGYRALMSALCSDRIQSLQDAWASLRQLHTTTAVEFESRLRPEFLGCRENHTSSVTGEDTHEFNGDDENNVDALLQLPPNATIPDPMALAVLYDHMYNIDEKNSSSNTIVSSINDKVVKEEKNYRPSSLFTSPLLLSPTPWFSLSSGISGGLGALSASDYGIYALHVLCIQYSEWVKQSFDTDGPSMSSARPLVLQLDRFRSNFRALLHQYSDDEDCQDSGDDEEYDYEDAHVYSCYREAYQEKSNYDQDDSFAYERNYEDKVEEYGRRDGNYLNCDDDDDDDDATVICCSNSSSITTISSIMATTSTAINTNTASTLRARVDSKSNKTAKDDTRHRRTLEDDCYCYWIKDVGAYSQSTAPLNTIFRTELHIRLFWPPTLLLLSDNDKDNAVENQPVVPAYALGTTYVAKAATLQSFKKDDGTYCYRDTQSSPILDSLITEQLDRAARDMRLRYNVMDKYLDGACAYSTYAVKAINSENIAMVNQQKYQHCEKT